MMKGNCYYSVRLVVIIACVVWFENINNGSCSSSGDENCIGVLEYLSPCDPYTSRLNPTPEPSPSCCNALQTVDTNCMCRIILNLDLNRFDRERAIGLPQLCHLSNDGQASPTNLADCFKGSIVTL